MVFSYQNRGQMGSRYIYIYIICFFCNSLDVFELHSDEHITWKWMAWSLGRLLSSTNTWFSTSMDSTQSHAGTSDLSRWDRVL